MNQFRHRNKRAANRKIQETTTVSQITLVDETPRVEPTEAVNTLSMSDVIGLAKSLSLPSIDFTVAVRFEENVQGTGNGGFSLSFDHAGILAFTTEARHVLSNAVLEVCKQPASWGLSDRFVPLLNSTVEAANRGLVNGSV